MTVQQLQAAIASLFPAARYPGSYTMTVDTSGNATLALWDNALGTPPTTQQLADAVTALALPPAKTAQIETIQTAYLKARFGTPVSITSGSNTLTFPTDTLTQSNIEGYLAAFAAGAALGSSVTLPSTVPLEDNSGTVQSLTIAEIQQLAVGILNQSTGAFNTWVSLKAQIAAATTVSQVQDIVWPS